ncbi:MAG: PQQ-dependent sugar dehydrogenase [Acidimicrobiia bacterium]|nr:PQQ-dependent sugar dehydrogenase [Acidimicrobiia bacterium]MDH3463374.1 PQQ-dependent sugar dehydrogenase [Acidimicrobiia bacterium]
MKRIALLTVILAACSGAGSLAAITSRPTADPTTAATTAASSSSAPTTLPSTSTTTLPELLGLEYELVADKLPFPVQVTARPGGDVSYVVTKDGRVWALIDGKLGEDPVLNIIDRVRDSGEQGLLALALHPEDSGLLYVHYTGNGGQTVISEFRMTSDLAADAASERILLELPQPASNHNGGMIQFDTEGYLVVGLGDGGGANDTYGNGQNQETLLGGLVRIDAATGDAELFNYGLRNPWRFWISEGLVYVADVGQNEFEEVSVAAYVPGVNFGWPITEGLHCFKPSTGCDTAGLTLPVVEVAHGDAGSCSITGGLVYFGTAIPEIAGQYFYSDYCGGYLRSLLFVNGDVESEIDWNLEFGVPVPGRVTGFGHDVAGEMYVTTENEVLKLVAVR